MEEKTMKNETKEKLQGILDKYKEKELGLLMHHERTKNERKIFLTDFSSKINDTIRPCFEEVGKLLKSRGHGFEITQKAESRDHQGNIQSAQIKIELLPNGMRSDSGVRPAISFIANSTRREIWTQVSTIMSGCAGQRSVYTLDEITEDIVEEEVLSVLVSCFG
jgi:hypothetical protein